MTGTLPLGNIRIEGFGRVDKDRTLMDVHFELINDQTNASQVLRPVLVTNESIVSLKRTDETAVKQATVITSSPVFGDVQTGKILTRIVIKNGQFAKLSFALIPSGSRQYIVLL